MKLTQLACFQHLQWDPKRDELRRFAGAMLVGFALLGLGAAWRRHGLGPPTFAFWSVGITLAVMALIPGLGRIAYLGVYLPTTILGYGVSHGLLTVIFFVVVTPLGFALRLMGKDLLQMRRSAAQHGWYSRGLARGRQSYYRRF